MPTPKESYRIGYKVVFKGPLGGLVSSWANRFISSGLEDGQVEYAVGKRTTPRLGCGPLAVFGDVADARGYVSLNRDILRENCEIYRCKYRKSRKTEMFCPGFFGHIVQRAAPLKAFPSSALATWVELIEEV